ncbi:MAG: hypothetical protein QGG40_02485 [Myxococcota bacterium]|jgi:hypothetical protein|nr:hypothetical protein [Myxococcota bacterium]
MGRHGATGEDGELQFTDPFDSTLATRGPPAVFTIDADGELRLDAMRSRNAWESVDGPPELEACHCLFRDRATGWVQYVLVTSPALCREHARAEIVRYPSQAQALEALRALGLPPVRASPLSSD